MSETMTPVRLCHYPRRDGPLPAGAKWVGRPSRWGNPFKVGSHDGLARVPAVIHAGREWEHENRISAAGMRHDYHHGAGRVTVVNVRRMTVTESIACYRAWVTGSGWPLTWAQPPKPADWLDPLRDATALACACPLGTPCHVDVLIEMLREAGR